PFARAPTNPPFSLMIPQTQTDDYQGPLSVFSCILVYILCRPFNLHQPTINTSVNLPHIRTVRRPLTVGPSDVFTFKMEDKGQVISIKFSADMNVLAIQRTYTSVEFVNYNSGTGLDVVEYSQVCKSKNATIQGFVWIHGNEILLITDHGVELFSVNPAKRSVKALKSLSLGVNWYVYCPRSNMILLSSGTIGNQMQALHITPGNLHKITKFEMEAIPAKPGKLAVSDRDVVLAVLYGTPCIIVLRHQYEANKSISAYVCVYTVHK
ncbi:hypothetical protein G9C98_007918, partial [Cotesia typhae]